MPTAKRRPSAVSDSEHHDTGRQQVEAQPVAPQRGEEPGPDLQSDRVHEQHEAQLAHELAGALGDVHAEVAEGDPDEEHARDAEADAAQAHGAEGEAQGRHEREDEDRSRRRLPVQ